MKGQRYHALGLMSGTSMDGVDAVLCRFQGDHLEAVVATAHQAYPRALRQPLLKLQRNPDAISLHEWATLDNAVARSFAEAAEPLLRRATIDVIGSHGQTVFHDPAGVASSLQLGNPSLIAALTKTPVIADFRRADIAQGGQGAPLVPAFHHAQFAQAAEERVVANIGGIANVTILPGDNPHAVRGWDTGPGNALMDEWASQHLGQPYDRNGDWARSGQVVPALLDSLLGDPWFSRLPPKSTGRDYFHLDWVAARHPNYHQLAAADVQRTLCELTARSLAQDAQAAAPRMKTLLLCGGGARNGLLVERLRALLDPAVEISGTSSQGLDEMAVEGTAFAWLAMRRWLGLTGSLPAVTGAREAAILGGIYAA